MVSIKDYLNEKKRAVDQALDEYLPVRKTRPGTLHEAMRYSVFSGGKRLRPALCLATAEALVGPEKAGAAMRPGCAVEILHAYTLVHDDLPAMDDDELRRGMPTTHVKFGEATAILAGDALLTLAFEWLAQCQAPAPYVPNQLSIELAEAAGSRGVIAGQVEDLAAENTTPDLEALEYIHLHKTAALFRGAIRMGAISVGADPTDLDTLTNYAVNLGLAFQIVDDILDETSTTEALGKPVGSDLAQGKATYPAILGLEAAKKHAQQKVEIAIAALKDLTGDAGRLVAMAEFVIERTN